MYLQRLCITGQNHTQDYVPSNVLMCLQAEIKSMRQKAHTMRGIKVMTISKGFGHGPMGSITHASQSYTHDAKAYADIPGAACISVYNHSKTVTCRACRMPGYDGIHTDCHRRAALCVQTDYICILIVTNPLDHT